MALHPFSQFTQEKADLICSRIADGESLKSICESLGMSRATVFRWLSQVPEFEKQYIVAREEQAEYHAEQIIAIADEAEVEAKYEGEQVRLVLDSTAVARNRLRVDARKWIAAKLLPKKYGDRQQIDLDAKVAVRSLDQELSELNANADANRSPPVA